ncbi:MAG: DNA cytosine methyltransferase [Bifidobacteriaceae bacterium]|jgi:DNA (cytosine-5)-methyltransferase 1|nr:DNA cytosine methyltransferase [Bifidobacteriaceae bacterium]
MGPVAAIDPGGPKVLEFFAGIGLARMGLEAAGFRVVWANDCEPAKAAMYAAQFPDSPDHVFALGDIGQVRAADLPPGAALAWASSPCTDLSLAGGRAGLAGAHSGAFWHVIRLLEGLGSGRPEVVVLENVTGLATSHGGEDIKAAVRAFNGLGYWVDVLAIDARRFVPQSRPRLFLVGASHPPPSAPETTYALRPNWLEWLYHDKALRTHRAALPAPPAPKLTGLGDLVEDMPPDDARWWGRQRTEAFMASLSPTQRERVEALLRAPGVRHRTAYRRTRGGAAVWEVRADEIAGCLRTARGGSSKQALVRLGAGRLQARWLTPLECARLMGAGGYDFGAARANQALFGFGDAVAVPVVAWLAEHYLMPAVKAGTAPNWLGRIDPAPSPPAWRNRSAPREPR